jgi:tetratricopeptide (TPR) repeat protein
MVVSICLVTAVTAVGIGIWVYRQKIEADNQEFNTLLAEQQQLMAYSKFDQAASLWTSYAAKSPNRSHRGMAYLNAGALYITNRQFTQAATMVQKAEAADGITFNEAEEASTVYLQLGNKPEAIHYYQEAIRLIPPSEDKTADIAGFKEAIKELQAGQ